MKRLICIFLLCALLCALFAGCDRQTVPEEEDGPVTVTVVTEYGASANFGTEHFDVSTNLINIMAEYQIAHPDVKIDLQFLPMDGDERKIVLQRMRTDIMAGNGPDLFLLPAGKVFNGQYENLVLSRMQEPLFSDVEQAMRSRLFYDLSEFYGNDTDLHTEELQQSVMAAGVYKNKRYVLPIAWDMPVAVYDPEGLAANGLEPTLFEKGLYEIYDDILQTESEALRYEMRCLPRRALCLFPNIFDYDHGKTTLTEDVLNTFYERYDELRVPDYIPDYLTKKKELSGYAIHGANAFLDTITPFSLTTLGQSTEIDPVLWYLAMGRAEGQNIQAAPLRSIDGTTVAEVAYWGAMNANCAHPKAAYDFLRVFLTPEIQLQQKYGGTSINFSGVAGVDCAWPVRVTGSVERKGQLVIAAAQAFVIDRNNENAELTVQRREKLAALVFADEDLPFLFEPIDEVRFSTPITAEFDHMVAKTEEKAKRIAELAAYHLAES